MTGPCGHLVCESCGQLDQVRQRCPVCRTERGTLFKVYLRAHASQAADGAYEVLSIADLPDEVLVRCLCFLELRERLSGPALVSRRMAALCHSPELLWDVDTGKMTSLAALRSLALWLARHAPHVRQLDLCPDSLLEEDEGSAAEAALTACLAAAGAGGQLTHLGLEGWIPNLEWLAAMRSLRSLWLDSAGELRVSAPVGALSSLETLSLQGYYLDFEAGARLPASVTWLRLIVTDPAGKEMPRQVSELPQLARLYLTEYFDDAGLAPLSRLSSSLTRRCNT
ncbi:2-isopropylmalate synthase homocitrate synthase family [Chlorella sorokiniana]|uniref:2-isopropylmalate synthase homocitrate synthase family n=1 Tax=Chlorella sorokiniana TaxID=3076 RepID=A0A2P6TEB4_CHLSO|nr:2-isopropylmalate synthase homocitrate synthase family [Chlorella sorokiniana]|eukprot:PRW20977.1 2-isopropylmalate synthase homocitrate synthase family [Chlorella sorokiniana]